MLIININTHHGETKRIMKTAISKTSKFIALAMMFLASFTAFTACSSDDGDDSNIVKIDGQETKVISMLVNQMEENTTISLTIASVDKKNPKVDNLTFSVPEQWMKYILAKGSIAIDGVSLTIAKKQSNSFFVSLIPHTGEMTILLLKQIGDPVNIECDCIGKYIEQLIGHNTSSSIGVTMDTLIAGGYKGHYGK